MLILGLLYAVPGVFVAGMWLSIIKIGEGRIEPGDLGAALLVGLIWPLVVIKLL